MTRINVVPVTELMDQHLQVEHHEFPRIPKGMHKSIDKRGEKGTLEIIPETYRLGTGHMTFFYDKGMFLMDRWHQIIGELNRRKLDYEKDLLLGSYAGLSIEFMKPYEPTPEALEINRKRLAAKISLHPDGYRYKGVPFTKLERKPYEQ